MDCQHVRQTPKLFTKSNVAVSVRLQCDDCGAGLQEKSKAGFDITTLKPFDFEARRLYDDARYKSFQSEHEERRAKERAEWFAAYNQYLVSEHWQRIRAEVLQRDQWCQVCFRKPSEQAHHVSYDSLNRFDISFAVECVGVCLTCHQELHEKGAL